MALVSSDDGTLILKFSPALNSLLAVPFSSVTIVPLVPPVTLTLYVSAPDKLTLIALDS